MADTLLERCRRNAVLFEGLKLTPYKCPAGKLTIGIGTNLEAGITVEEAYYLCDNRLKLAICDLKKKIFREEWDGFPSSIQEVLVDMRFNLGADGFLKFKKMIAAARARDWAGMIREMLESKWAKQVGYRAVYLVGQVCDEKEKDEGLSDT